SRLRDAELPGRIGARETVDRRFARAREQDEFLDQRRIPGNGIAAEVLTDAQRDVDLGADRRRKRGRLDPEIVRAEDAGEKPRRGGDPGRAEAHEADWARNFASRSRSRLPPERTTPTRWPAKSALRWRTAAAPAAPEGSIKSFIRSSIQHRVSAISRS